MSLHVSGQEAHNCLAFAQKAFQRWEKEQAALEQAMAKRDRTQRPGIDKTKPRQFRKPRRDGSRPDLGAPRKHWTPEKIAAAKAGIAAGWSTHYLATQIGTSQKTAWLICSFLRNQPQTQPQPITHSHP